MARPLPACDGALPASPGAARQEASYQLRLPCLSCLCHCPGEALDGDRDAEIAPPRGPSASAGACSSPSAVREPCGGRSPSTEAGGSPPTAAQDADSSVCADGSCESSSSSSSDGSPSRGAGGLPGADEREARAAIGEALRQGRVHEAERQLARLKAPERLGAAQAERILRVGACYRASVKDLLADPGDGWVSERVEGLSYSYRLADGQFQIVSTVESTADPIRALASILEVDLCRGYKPNVISGTALGDAEPDPLDAVWHVMQTGRFGGALEDDITLVSVVDALDEELGSIWAGAYPPADVGSLDLHGLRLPAPQPGASRQEDWRTSFRLTPLRDLQGAGRPSFRLSTALSVRPSRAALAVLSRMPGWALRLAMSRSAGEMLGSFARHMDTCEELRRRVEASPRAAFYERMGRRLAGEAPAAALLGPAPPPADPQVPAGGGALRGAAGEGAAAAEEPAETPAAGGLLTWDELSALLPLDWASYQD